MRLSTHDLAFGHQTINTSTRQYVKMENIGNDTLDISSISTPLGSAFSVEDDCENALAAGNYCGLLVYFEPTAVDDYVSTLTIVDNSYTSPEEIDLSGTGIAAGSADISIEKTHVHFGDQILGSETTDTITLTSSGTIDLDLDLIAISGDTFSQTNDCPATLAPEATCTITATFSPTIAGSYDGVITLTNNATDSPQTIALSGKGVSPNATLIPSLIDFGNQTINKSSIPQEVLLVNSGTSALTISEISTSSSIYSQTNTCSDTLAAKETCVILITFSPLESGESIATLIVASDDPTSPAEVFLFGNGITGPDVDIYPPLYDFGNTTVGEISEQQNFLIQNTGEGDLILDSITVNSDFEQTNDCPTILEEEEICVVETIFVPTVSGNFFGTLSIVDNAEGSPHKASLRGYGVFSSVTLLPASINFGDQTIGMPSLAHDARLLNSGNETITIESITSSNAVFAQTNDCGSSLAPSGFCTISVIFTPDTTEYLTAQITITDSATGSPHNISLTGSGIDPIYPDLDITPNFWDFGQILVGNTSDAKEFTVKNTGAVDVIISDIDANSEFAQTNDCPETLASGETCTISGTFAPQAAGQFSGHIRVVDNTYSRYQTILLKGSATHSGDINISLSESIINFGDITVNTSSDEQSVILTNAGTDDVTIGAVAVTGSEATDFSMNTNCNNRSLDVDKSCLINATFKPTSAGSKTANIMIYDDAHDSPQIVVLSGTGTNSSGCALTRNIGNQTISIIGLLSAMLSLLYFLRHTVKRRKQIK